MPRGALSGPTIDEAPSFRRHQPKYRIDRHLLIDGALSTGESGQRFPSVDPATGVIVGFAPDCTVHDVELAVSAARRAFDATQWSTDLPLRTACLKQLQAALIDHCAELRRLAMSETGATWRLTEGPYLDAPIASVGRYAESLTRPPVNPGLVDAVPRGRRRPETRPVGVVVIRIGSSHPLRMAIEALGPALAAGCTAVLKGSPETALTTLALGELIASCTAFPAGVVNVLSSLDPSVDVTLAAHRHVDLITFTGSIAAGRRMVAAASGSVKRISMKPERKSTAIILDDADFAACAADIALMATSHAGQGSAPISRILVPARQRDSAVAELKKCLAAVRYGDPADVRTWMGPLISDRRRDEVDELVKAAVAAGATLVTGGGVVRPGYFYEPTLLLDVGTETEASAASIGGPVLVVATYDDDRDAVRVANRSACGPSGVVYGSHERALAVARGVRTGRMSINGGSHLGPDRLFGCAEENIMPVEGSDAVLQDYLEGLTSVVGIPEQEHCDVVDL